MDIMNITYINDYHESWHSVLPNRHPQPRCLDRPEAFLPPLHISPFHKPLLFFSSSFPWDFCAKDHVLTARSLRFLLVEDDASDGSSSSGSWNVERSSQEGKLCRINVGCWAPIYSQVKCTRHPWSIPYLGNGTTIAISASFDMKYGGIEFGYLRLRASYAAGIKYHWIQ